MKNYICQILTPKVSSRFLGKVSVPEEGLKAGQVVVADALDQTILGNIEVYSAKKVTADNLKSKLMAVVLNDGFEELADCRRPDGNPNYYTYTYKAGDVAPIAFLGKHLMFNIGLDSIVEGTKTLATVGNYLIPTANSTELSASESIPSGVSVALKILAQHNTYIGGNYGGGCAPSLVCTPVYLGTAATNTTQLVNEDEDETTGEEE